MKRLKIADLQVDIEVKSERLLKQCVPYEDCSQLNSAADITVKVSENTIAASLKRHPNLTEEIAEYLSAGSSFYTQLIDFDGIMLHASGVVKDGYAYLFSADPGTGKSTHTHLWCEHIEGTYIINDDKPAIRKTGNELFVYGTPFSGKKDISANKKVKLGGICLIYRSEKNVIERISAEEAIVPILRQTIYRLSEDKLDKFLKLLDDILSNVPVYKMGCNISEQAALLSYNTMKRTKDNA